MHFSNKNDIFNNLFAFGALFFVFIHIPIVLLLMFQVKDFHKELLPLFLFALGLPLLIISITIIISTAFLYFYKVIFKSKDLSKLENKIEVRMQKTSKLRKDSYRKVCHILIFIGLFIVWFISYDFVKNNMSKKNEKPKIEPKTTNMLYLYLRLLTKPNSIKNVLFSLEWFYYILFFFFYSFTLIMLANELTRKTRYLMFPFNFMKFLMYDEEKQKYGTYLFFTIGQMFAAFTCPPMVFFAILGMSSIGDLATSQIGMKFGKKHLSWNKKKSFEGALVGTFVSFVLCYFFVGFIYAAIFALSFMCIDLFTRKPLNVSDNLLNPIGCALLFIFIRFGFDLDYNPIILYLLRI
ncbi:MAG: hypothetical protein ACFFAN_11045 [Promethearchaeota archaeon]